MSVYFCNSGCLELDVIRTMGVSVKSETAIGYFGTGLKYAIATLLRTDHEVTLIIDQDEYKFTARPKEIRGKTFHLVFMNEEQLSFTTDLGRDWKVWQAYRELYSNTLDERGSIGYIREEADTIFKVSGPEIDDVHGDRSSIFLQNEPWIVGDGVDIHRGRSSYVFYRGVRVHKLVKPSMFTYNFTCLMALTEDRTLASVYDMNYKFETRLPKIPDQEFAMKFLEPSWEGFESQLSVSSCYEPSEEFLDSLEYFKDDVRLNGRADMLKVHRNVEDHTIFELTDTETEKVQQACDLLKEKLNVVCFVDELFFVENLGPNVMAQAKAGKIYITRQCLANGFDYLAITIYEEWIHTKMGYPDMTRGMQQFLFDKILELIKR